MPQTRAPENGVSCENLTPYTFHLTYTPHPTSYILHLTPHTLHPTPYTLHPTPYTLQTTDYTVQPAPSNLHPPPSTPHPSPTLLLPPPSTLHTTPYALQGVASTSLPWDLGNAIDKGAHFPQKMSPRRALRGEVTSKGNRSKPSR